MKAARFQSNIFDSTQKSKKGKKQKKKSTNKNLGESKVVSLPPINAQHK